MLDCPACAGPTALGGDCATCKGMTQVSQKVYDAFMQNQTILIELADFQMLITNAVQLASSVGELKQTIAELIN